MYRSAASTDKTYETLHELEVRAPIVGLHRAWWLFTYALLAALVAPGAAAFAIFTPFTAAGYLAALSPVVAVMLGARAKQMLREHRRTLRLERAEDGSGHRLVVEGCAPLAFPLVAKRIDLAFDRDGERFERIALHLEGADGGELVLRELPIELGGTWSDIISSGEMPVGVTPPELEFEVSLGAVTDLLERVQR